MSQTYNDNTYEGTHNIATDMQNIEDDFAALKSLFSGAGAPGNTVAGMPWMDTTQKVLKYRNAANGAWYGLMHGDVSQKILVYRDAAMDGWAIDATATDRVIALKGGTTYTTGGAVAGSWTISGLAHTHTITHTHTYAHNHKWYENNAGSTFDQTYDSGGSLVTLLAGQVKQTTSKYHIIRSSSDSDSPIGDSWTSNSSGNTSGSSAADTGSGGTSDAAWRIAAAVCTMQYLDL